MLLGVGVVLSSCTGGRGAVNSIAAAAIPTITVSTGSLNLGTTTAGTAGTAQTYTVSGSNLTAEIVLTAPEWNCRITAAPTEFASTRNEMKPIDACSAAP